MLGNKAASGTAIIDEYGAQHLKGGEWIVYTSADSVFQVAASEEKVPLKELYAACQAARDMLQGDDAVSRVIASSCTAGRPRGTMRRRRKRSPSPDRHA